MKACVTRAFNRHLPGDFLVYYFVMATWMGRLIATTTPHSSEYDVESLELSVASAAALALILVTYENCKAKIVVSPDGAHRKRIPLQKKEKVFSIFSVMLYFDALYVFFPSIKDSLSMEHLMLFAIPFSVIASLFAYPYLKDSVEIGCRLLESSDNLQESPSSKRFVRNMNALWGLSLSSWSSQFLVSLPEELGFHSSAVDEFQHTSLFYALRMAAYSLYTAYAIFIACSLKGKEGRFINHLKNLHALFIATLCYRGYSHSMYLLLLKTNSLEGPPFALYTAVGLCLAVLVFIYERNNVASAKGFGHLNHTLILQSFERFSKMQEKMSARCCCPNDKKKSNAVENTSLRIFSGSSMPLLSDDKKDDTAACLL